MITEEVREIATGLAFACGGGPISDIFQRTGGGNNRGFEVRGRIRMFLKLYFQHPCDPRDRLRAEYDFCELLWNQGLRSAPQPLVRDPSHHAALYEFIEGRSLSEDEITEGRILEAVEFLLGVNELKTRARPLNKASEACFSLDEHLECVGHRVQGMLVIGDASEEDREASVFVRQHLLPAWERIKKQTIEWSSRVLGRTLSDAERCVSPSDFGFHNALLTSHDRLRFIDFEYAGWDDPAKLACDFFCQPALPVPVRFLDAFLRPLLNKFGDPDLLRERIRLLLPVYRIKWCCILLNEYLPAGKARRRFADKTFNSDHRKPVQLARARDLLESALRSEARS
ncbi:MAG: aminoglycoside phosphotransferase family protein [Verrucomicrobia bacterium]|nr:aminoglycoside phosphotransferase family protein [Verrucomicrobiota bacterium]